MKFLGLTWGLRLIQADLSGEEGCGIPSVEVKFVDIGKIINIVVCFKARLQFWRTILQKFFKQRTNVVIYLNFSGRYKFNDAIWFLKASFKG